MPINYHNWHDYIPLMQSCCEWMQYTKDTGGARGQAQCSTGYR